MTHDTSLDTLYEQNRTLGDLYNFAMQFFVAIRKQEKKKLRSTDRKRLAKIRNSPRYQEAYTTEQPLISIIIPTYNRAKLIVERTLPSIFRQTYPNWEVIVVGDQMSDADAASLKDFRHPRVRFINLKRRGRYPEEKGPFWYSAGIKPVNLGLRIAGGQWIAHLDDDDEFLSDHLERLLELARSSRAEWAHAKTRFIADDGATEVGVIGEPQPRLGGIARISSIYHAALKTFRYNQNCWKYYYPGDWDLWERFLEMEVRHVHLDRVTAIHHGNIGRVSEIARQSAQGASNDSPWAPTSLSDPVRSAEEMLARERDTAYQDWIENHKLRVVDGEILAERISVGWTSQPVIEVITVVPQERQELLADTIDALAGQLYGNWRLTVLADFPCPSPELAALPMIQWQQTTATRLHSDLNTAVRVGQSDWFMLLPAGARLAPQFSARVGDYVNRNPSTLVIYTDEDRIDRSTGLRSTPQFKPAINPDLLRSTNYLGSSVVFRRRPEITVCNWRTARLELSLQALEASGCHGFVQIADVLCHVPTETEENRDEELEREVLVGHLQRQGIAADVGAGFLPGTFRIEYRHPNAPLVSVIICNRDKFEFLEPCVESLLAKTDYPAFELVIVDNQSTDPDVAAYYKALEEKLAHRVQVLFYPHEFNYSAQCNLGAGAARGDYLLFLNNDTQIVHPEWLTRMMNLAQRPEVGVVGPRLSYPESGKVQHVGVVLGLGDGAEHHYAGHLGLKDPGYMNRAQVVQGYSAVTGACLLTRKTVFEALGGLDDQEFRVNYSDIDFCLKVRQAGLDVLWTPYATLIHHGSISIKSDVTDYERQAAHATRHQREGDALLRKWLPAIAADPAYNINLSMVFRDMRPEGPIPVGWDPNCRERPRILGLPLPGGSGDYRVIQPFNALSDAGLAQTQYARFHRNKYRALAVPELARHAPDTLLVHAALNDVEIKALERYKKFLPEIHRVFSLDDLVTQVPEKSSAYANFMRNFRDSRSRLRRALALCDRLVVSTPYLAEVCQDFIQDIVIVPNRLQRAPWKKLTALRNQGRKPRVGWAGAQQHKGDLDLIETVVKALGNEVEWVFMGMCTAEIRPFLHEFHGFVKIDDYPAKLAGLSLDLALAPLEETPFNRGKSNLRLLEYGALGWPVVCTDIDPYRIADAPVTRLPNIAEAWIETIRTKIANPQELGEDGQRLRNWVHDGFILEDHLDEWVAALTEF